MSALGFGASGPWAERWFQESKAEALIATAYALGLRHLDTGPSYGRGKAEPRLGRVLARLEAGGTLDRSAVAISSKAGTQIGEAGRLIKDFRPEAIMAQLAASLSALGTQRLDVCYLHGPDKHELSSALPVLMHAKETGKIRAIGICANRQSVMTAARQTEVDWVMAPFNVLDQSCREGLDAARSEGKKIVVVAPLAQALWRRGLFAPRTLSDVWYLARALITQKEQLSGMRRARFLSDDFLRDVPGWSPAALSIAFIRQTLAPDLILTTTTRPAHLAETAGAMTADIPQDVAAVLQGLTVS